MKNLMKRVLLVLVLMLSVVVSLPAQKVGENGDGGRSATPAGESPQANQEVKDENDAYRHSAMVQKIGHAMGMSTETAATVTFEVFNFAILAIAVGGFLLKALPKTFRNAELGDPEASGGCAHGDGRSERAAEQRGRSAGGARRADCRDEGAVRARRSCG